MSYCIKILILIISIIPSIFFFTACSAVRHQTGLGTPDEKQSTQNWILSAGDDKYRLTYRQIGVYIKGTMTAVDDINNRNDISGTVTERNIHFQIYRYGMMSQEYTGNISQDGLKMNGTRNVNGNRAGEWSAENINIEY